MASPSGNSPFDQHLISPSSSDSEMEEIKIMSQGKSSVALSTNLRQAMDVTQQKQKSDIGEDYDYECMIASAESVDEFSNPDVF